MKTLFIFFDINWKTYFLVFGYLSNSWNYEKFICVEKQMLPFILILIYAKKDIFYVLLIFNILCVFATILLE